MTNDVSEFVYHPMRDHAGRFMRPMMLCHLIDLISRGLQWLPDKFAVTKAEHALHFDDHDGKTLSTARLCRYVGTSDDPSALRI